MRCWCSACQHVGIPSAPVSPAYSLLSRDFGKLRGIMRADHAGHGVRRRAAREYQAAIAATVPPDVELVVTADPPAGRAATAFADLLAT